LRGRQEGSAVGRRRTAARAPLENRDGSWALRFDDLPARMGKATIPMRKIEP
jgi:hypothetical protein